MLFSLVILTYTLIAETYYCNLSTPSWVQEFNTYLATNIPDSGVVNVTVNCSCGDSSISKEYDLFITYPLRFEDSLASIANESVVSAELLTRYNPSANFNAGSGIVHVPCIDVNGIFFALPAMISFLDAYLGLGAGAIAGIAIRSVAGDVVLALLAYFGIFWRRMAKGP